MTGQRVLPNLGLTNKWTPGSSGWAAGMDSDLAMMDALLFLSVISMSTTTPPTSPTAGDRYIVATGGTGAWNIMDGKVAVFLDAAWEFLTPKNGWVAHIQDTGGDARFDGTNWNPIMVPYTLQVWRYKMPADAAEPLFSVQVERPVVLPPGLTLSRATCKIAPSVTNQILPIFQNTTQVGNITFLAGATTGSFNVTSAVTLAAGDIFEVYRPATPDPAFGGVRLTFAGNR